MKFKNGPHDGMLSHPARLSYILHCSHTSEWCRPSQPDVPCRKIRFSHVAWSDKPFPPTHADIARCRVARGVQASTRWGRATSWWGSARVNLNVTLYFAHREFFRTRMGRMPGQGFILSTLHSVFAVVPLFTNQGGSGKVHKRCQNSDSGPPHTTLIHPLSIKYSTSVRMQVGSGHTEARLVALLRDQPTPISSCLVDSRRGMKRAVLEVGGTIVLQWSIPASVPLHATLEPQFMIPFHFNRSACRAIQMTTDLQSEDSI